MLQFNAGLKRLKAIGRYDELLTGYQKESVPITFD